MEDYNSHILGIERSVIASILFEPSGFDEMSDNLQARDFLHPSHRHIFEVCLELKSQNLPITLDFAIPRLTGKRQISDDEMQNIITTSPIANIQGYVQEIKDASIKRELTQLASFIRDKAFDPTLQSDAILEDVEKRVYEIASQGAHTDFQTSHEISLEILQNIKTLKERGNSYITGLATNFSELDKITTGFNKGELIVIGARPSMGKTALVLQMVQAFLNRDNGVAIFSLEMKATDLMLRMLSSLTSIPFQDLRLGRLDENQLEVLNTNISHMATKPLYIDDGSLLSIGQLRSKLRKLKSQEPNINVAVIDYLQLMCGSGAKKDSVRHEEISEISRGLKTLARDLQIPIIALSQLNRMLESRDDKRPMLSDLRESGAIEQDADIILFLYRDFIYKRRALKAEIADLERKDSDQQNNKVKLKKKQDELRALEQSIIHEAEIIIAKNRNGETKDVKIQFHSTYIRFEDKASEKEIAYMPNTKFDSGESGVEIIPI